MPWQALYYHDGESIFCTQFVHEYGYSGLNIGGKSYFNTPTHLQVSHRDSRGRDVAYEHTEFTSGDEIKKAAAEAGIDLSAQYEGTAFSFASPRTRKSARPPALPRARSDESPAVSSASLRSVTCEKPSSKSRASIASSAA